MLSGRGLLRGEREEEGVVLATRIVGEERLSELRDWLEALPPEQLDALRGAAVELCIWMAVADRVIDPAERDLLADIVRASGLGADEEERLVRLLAAALGDVRKLAHVETLAERLDHPILRELMLAMTWHIARADGFVDALEDQSYERLAGVFGVDMITADRIREALEQA